ncbi:uncharacterized protein LOC144485969 isoform X2 [Mustelus asterias]
MFQHIICNGTNCTKNFRATFNESVYEVCIYELHQPCPFNKGLYLEVGNATTSESVRVELSSDDVCLAPGPSEAPAVDQQQFNTTQGPGPSTGARVGLGFGILVVVFVVAGIGIYIFQKRQRRCFGCRDPSDRDNEMAQNRHEFAVLNPDPLGGDEGNVEAGGGTAGLTRVSSY